MKWIILFLAFGPLFFTIPKWPIHVSRQSGKIIGIDARWFGGWIVVYCRDVFAVWWSTDATPPTKREGNGRWIIGTYGKWARSKFA